MCTSLCAHPGIPQLHLCICAPTSCSCMLALPSCPPSHWNFSELKTPGWGITSIWPQAPRWGSHPSWAGSEAAAGAAAAAWAGQVWDKDADTPGRATPHQGQHPSYERIWALLTVACRGPCSSPLDNPRDGLTEAERRGGECTGSAPGRSPARPGTVPSMISDPPHSPWASILSHCQSEALGKPAEQLQT